MSGVWTEALPLGSAPSTPPPTARRATSRTPAGTTLDLVAFATSDLGRVRRAIVRSANHLARRAGRTGSAPLRIRSDRGTVVQVVADRTTDCFTGVALAAAPGPADTWWAMTGSAEVEVASSVPGTGHLALRLSVGRPHRAKSLITLMSPSSMGSSPLSTATLGATSVPSIEWPSHFTYRSTQCALR